MSFRKNSKDKFRGNKRTNASKNERRSTPNAKEAERYSKANDPMWYVIDAQMARDVGSLSFNNSLGNPIDFSTEDASSVPGYKYGAVPGICCVYTTPAVGYAGSEVDGVNIASKNIYSFVRHDNSGHTNYDSPDLMLYLLAMDSIYSMAAAMMRIYGVGQVFTQKNKYLGEVMLKSLGMDPTDVYARLADFRAYINIFITKMGTMCVPAIMTYYLRHMWMYSSIFMDEDIAKSSFYAYVPAQLWKLNVEGATALEPIDVFQYSSTSSGIFQGFTDYDHLLTVSEVIGIAESLLNPIIANEDFNIMSGDILKAFGRENLFSMPLVPTEYMTIPVYSDEVLYQIHNTQFASNRPCNLSLLPSKESLWVIQDTSIGSGNLLFQPKFNDVDHLSRTRLMDFYKDEITPEDVIVASRNMLVGEKIDDPSAIASAIKSCGSEICMYANLKKFSSNGVLGSTVVCNGRESYKNNNNLLNLQKFNFAPTFIVLNSSGSPFAVFGDLGNYTMISAETVKKLHDSAILSMFGVPRLGNASGGRK